MNYCDCKIGTCEGREYGRCANIHAPSIAMISGIVPSDNSRKKIDREIKHNLPCETQFVFPPKWCVDAAKEAATYVKSMNTQVHVYPLTWEDGVVVNLPGWLMIEVSISMSGKKLKHMRLSFIHEECCGTPPCDAAIGIDLSGTHPLNMVDGE